MPEDVATMLDLVRWLTPAVSSVAFASMAATAIVTLGRSPGHGSKWLGRGLIGAIIAVSLSSALSVIVKPERPSLLLAASLFMLLVATLIWPFLLRLQASVERAIEIQVKRRSVMVGHQAFKDRRWLELAEGLAHVGHWYFDLVDQSLFWSDEVFHIHGVDKSQGVPDVVSAIAAYHPADRAIVEQSLNETVETGSGFDISVRLVRADGAVRHVTSRGLAQLDEKGKVIGIFGVFMDMTDQKLLEAALREANLRSEQTNAGLRSLAMADALTGLANRRRFDVSLTEEGMRAARAHFWLAVIMIDVDHFKSYNDIYGHQAGDDCLRQVAQLAASVPQRPGDLVARYGGEEFIVLLPNTDEAGAAAVAEHIRALVDEHALIHQGSPLGRVSVSCGVASVRPTGPDEERLKLVRAADRALYQAKGAGRNRICLSSIADRLTSEPLIV